MDPGSDIVEGMEGVQAIVEKLDEIEAGRLEVQPPLSEDQINAYREKTTTLLGIGQRAVEALENADSDRAGRFAAFFKGIGIASKR